MTMAHFSFAATAEDLRLLYMVIDMPLHAEASHPGDGEESIQAHKLKDDLMLALKISMLWIMLCIMSQHIVSNMRTCGWGPKEVTAALFKISNRLM